jgi:hypothetical protein
MPRLLRAKLLRSFVQKARSGIGNAARDLLTARAKTMDGAAILRHLSILLIFATVYNSDGVGLPILPPSANSEFAETNEQLEGAAFQALSLEAFLAAFATLSVRNHEVVATIEYDAPPANCNPPNTMSDTNATKTKYNLLSIANPEMAPKNVKEPLATSTSTTGEGKRKPEGKHFYTLTPSGQALHVMPCQDTGEWWDHIW